MNSDMQNFKYEHMFGNIL